jgi:hypothetical protein
MLELPVDSPELPVDQGIVHTPKEFVHNLVLDLTESEAQQALMLTLPIRSKYSAMFRRKLSPHSAFTFEEAMTLLNQFEDEIKTTLAEKMDLLVSVDMDPVFDGRPPTITFEGCLSGHDTAKYGMDHEKQEYDIKKAESRGEAFLGEKYDIDTGPAKRRSRNARKG